MVHHVLNFDALLASAVPVLDPVSKDARAIGGLFLIVFLICLAILAAVVAVICVSLFRFRTLGSDLPRQNFGNHLSETAWTVPPVLIVLTLSLLSAKLIVGQAAGAGDPRSSSLVINGGGKFAIPDPVP